MLAHLHTLYKTHCNIRQHTATHDLVSARLLPTLVFVFGFRDCSVLQCVAVCRNVLQCIAMCLAAAIVVRCSVLRLCIASSVAVCHSYYV